MTIRPPILLLLLASWLIAGSASARTTWWKPERTLGSAQLSLEAIDAIYLPAQPSARLVAAAEDLIRCWPGTLEQAGGVPSKQSLVLIRDSAFALQGLRRDETGGDGFSIRRERTRIYLRAASDEALANGLYAICRDLLGARWYWAGDLGFESVGEPAEKFPEGIWRERPAFVQRTLYPVATDFGRRNGLNRKYSFNHNLARIFTAEVYDASPEVFAEIGGVRQRPRRSAKYDPQPDFTEPKTVELAAEAARDHFRENPEANSFSLSINDNSLFDEGAATEAVVLQKVGDRRQETEDTAQGGPAVTSEATGSVEYFRGRPNYTDLVFGFMNQVADEVYEGGKVDARCDLETFDFLNFKPSRHPPYLTALAYYWTEQSPSFRLHPQIMPVLTSDRAQWHDPDYREEDKALIRRWVESGAARIATWDYYFGAPYPYPRQFTQWIGESITYLHEAGVDVFFSQLPAVWGLDGPKAWLTAELLRDPERDVQGLLDEFYREFFGAAAEPIRAFYETAEQTRNKRAGTANWIKFYKDEAGVELLDEATLMQMRAYLEEAKHAVRPERLRERASASGAPLESNRFADRVQVVSDAFAYTEAYASYHRRRVALVERAIAILNGNPTAAGEQQPVKASRSPLHDPVRRQGPPQGSPELAPSTENDALKACGGAALVQALAEYAAAKKSFDALKKELVKKPLHQGFSAFNRLKQSDPVPLALAALSKTESGLALGPDARAVATRASEGGGAGHHARNELEALRAWRNGDAEWVPAGKNPGLSHAGTERRNFLGPEIPAIDAWEIEYRASEGLAVDAAAGQSAAGLRIENADIVSLAQTYPVVGEKTYLLEIEANWRVSPDNRTRVQLNWESVGGDKLRTDIPLRLPNGTSAGGQRLQFVVTSPVNAYDLKLGIVTNRQYEGDFLEMTRVELGELVSEW